MSFFARLGVPGYAPRPSSLQQAFCDFRLAMATKEDDDEGFEVATARWEETILGWRYLASRAAEAVRHSSDVGWKAWALKAIEQGGRIAHRVMRNTGLFSQSIVEATGMSGGFSSAPIAVLEAAVCKWKGVWSAQDLEHGA